MSHSMLPKSPHKSNKITHLYNDLLILVGGTRAEGRNFDACAVNPPRGRVGRFRRVWTYIDSDSSNVTHSPSTAWRFLAPRIVQSWLSPGVTLASRSGPPLMEKTTTKRTSYPGGRTRPWKRWCGAVNGSSQLDWQVFWSWIGRGLKSSFQSIQRRNHASSHG